MPFPIRVADVMSHPARTTDPDTTVAEAAATCIEAGIGSLVVVEGGAPVGIVTTTDFLELLGTATDPAGRSVGEFMSTPLATTDADAPVPEAVAAMDEAGVARLAVIDDGDLVGLVSTDDVVRHVPQTLHRRRMGTPPDDRPGYRVRQETSYENPDWEIECVSRSEGTVGVGDRVTFAKAIDETDVRTFAAASGDTNRLHLDEEYAAGTRFGRRIVHGTLVGGLISAALARLPGVTIYLSQDLTFLGPVGVGDRVTAVCEVVESLGRNKYELTTDVFAGEDREQVIEGEAVVLVDEPPEAGRVEVETY